MKWAVSTTALRVCMRCRVWLGVERWPASHARFVVTHGLCRGCAQAEVSRLR